MRFLDGDIAVTADYFLNKRENILVQRNASIPQTAGLEGKIPDENIGKVENKGFDFSVDYHKRLNDFKFGVGFNGVFAKNKILFWDEAEGVPDYQQSTGRPINAGLYYNAIGILQNQEEIDAYPHWEGARPGDIKFEDYNNDSIIDGDDRVRYDKSWTPTFKGGVNIDLAYKNLDITILFQGAAGGIFYETTESGDFGNYLKSYYDERWTEENPSSEHPRTYNRNGQYWVAQRSTHWMHKSDYVRLKTIEMGYTLPQTFTSRILIKNLRIYASAYNLLTISPEIKDFDPEMIDNRAGAGYSYPLNKVLNFGLSVTF